MLRNARFSPGPINYADKLGTSVAGSVGICELCAGHFASESGMEQRIATGDTPTPTRVTSLFRCTSIRRGGPPRGGVQFLRPGMRGGPGEGVPMGRGVAFANGR